MENFRDNKYFSLNKDAEAANKRFADLYKKIKQLKNVGKDVDLKLAEEFSLASTNIEKFNKRLTFAVKQTKDIAKSVRDFRGLNYNKLIQNMGYTIDNSNKLLLWNNPYTGQRYRDRAAENSRVISSISQNEFGEKLNTQTKMERYQLGMMAADALEQGITQAAAAAEARYRALATDSAAKGQWVKAGEEFRTASNWNLGGNILEGAVATGRNFGAAYAMAGGGAQGVAAGVVVGLATAASQITKINQEYQQIQEDLKRLKDQIVTAASGIPTAFNELQFALSHEAIISDPLANEGKIKENLQFSKQYSDYMLSNAEITKTDIDALYRKNGTNVENWSDEDVQHLHALKSQYERFIGDYEKYSKLTSAYGAADKAVADYREAERLQKEEEYQRYEAANEALSENRLFAKDDAARTEFDKSLTTVAKADNISEAIRLLSEMDMTNASESINTQRARVAAYDTKINELNQKYEAGEASAAEVERLVELEQIRNSAMQQLQSDKDLYNSRNDVLQDLYRQQRDEVNSLAASASSSKHLAEDYGTFSRYFGKTDPSINLLKETNTVLRSILETIRYREGYNGIVYE